MPVLFKSKHRYSQGGTPVIFQGHAVMPRKPLDFAPQIGAIIFYVKRAFCSYLGGLWGLKTPCKTSEGMGRLVLPLNGHPPRGLPMAPSLGWPCCRKNAPGPMGVVTDGPCSNFNLVK